MGPIKPGDTFDLFLYTTGIEGPQDADFLPTAVQIHNGVTDGTGPAAVAVAKISTGKYHVSGTIVSTYASGDNVTIEASPTVNGITYQVALENFKLDDARSHDVMGRLGVPSGGLTVAQDIELQLLTSAYTAPDNASAAAAASAAATAAANASAASGNASAAAASAASALAAVTQMMGLVGLNTALAPNPTYDSNTPPNLTSFQTRVYNSPVNAANNDGSTGLQHVYQTDQTFVASTNKIATSVTRLIS